MKRGIIAIIIAALLGSAALLQSRHDSKTHYFAARNVTVNLPKASTLKVISLGHHDTLAELLFLWSIQFYSTTYYRNRWESLDTFFNTITDLSPDNPDFYLTGSITMAREANQMPAALLLLEKGAKQFPEDYIYYFWAGYFAASFLKDYKLAAQYQEKASKRPNALPGIVNLHAHHVYQQNDLDNAWKLFSELKKTSPHESIRESADRHLYDIQTELDQRAFKKIIETFQQKHQRLPTSIDEMVRLKFLNSPPADYNGDLYKYNQETGLLIPNKKASWRK